MTNFNTQSSVTWSYSLSDETGFILERSSNSGSTWNTILTCNSETTSFTDNSITWGDSKWYRVTAKNDFGNGQSSLLATVFINSPGIDAPRLSGSQFMQTTESLLNWDYSGSSQGSTDYFTIERSSDSGSTWPLTITVDPTGSSISDQSVSSPSTYLYRIRAHCNFGLYGPASNIVNIFISGSSSCMNLVGTITPALECIRLVKIIPFP